MGVLVIQVKRRPSALGPLPVRRVPPDYCYVFHGSRHDNVAGEYTKNQMEDARQGRCRGRRGAGSINSAGRTR